MADDDDLSYDVYIDQLKEVFESCDDQCKGYLLVSELDLLCDKLEIIDTKPILYDQLFQSSYYSNNTIYFEDFKNIFLNLLKETVLQKNENTSLEQVSPKFIVAGKKYGRRTKPENESLESDILEHSILNTPIRCSNNSLLFKSDNDTTTTIHVSQNDESEGHHNRSRNYSDQSIRWDREADETFESEGTDASTRRKSMCPLDVSEVDIGMEKLQQIWTELGVGRDGFLSLDELSQVCQHVGMNSMTDSDIQNIFENLDSDRDGKVSFDEFIRGFLHHATDQQENNLSPLSRVPQSLNKSRREDRNKTGTSIIADGGVAGLFSVLDTTNTGYAKPADVIDLWERVGIHRGASILTTLGFELDARINLGELSFSLERELLANNNQDLLYQAALATYQQEIKNLRFNLDNMSNERDKLKLDLSEANARNTLMAKEADERHVILEKSAESKLLSIEKKYTEQIKQLQSTLDEERESHTSVSSRYQKQLREHRDITKLEEGVLREQLHQAQLEVERLESDMAESVRRLGEAEKMIVRLQKELETTGELRQKLAEYERNQSKLSEESAKFSQSKFQKIEAENKGLKDRNDELTAEVEGIRQSMSLKLHNKRHSTGSRSTRIPVRSGSQLSDYVKPGRRKFQSLASYPSASEIEEDDPIFGINDLPLHDLPSPDLPSPDLPSPDGYESGSGNEISKVANLQKELRDNRQYQERELKEVEHAYRLEISQLEERHLAEKERILRSVEEAKVKENETFSRISEEMAARTEKDLQTSFALEKQDLVLKHESEKNLLEHRAAEERRKQTERLREEFDRDITKKMIELKNEFNTERTKLEHANRDQQITIQSLKRKMTEVDLKMKLQEEELSLQFDQERQDLMERSRLEQKHIEMQHKQQIFQYESMLTGGVDCLQGKLREDFYVLVSQQKEEELLVDRSAMLDHIQHSSHQHSSLLEDERTKLYNEFENEKMQIVEKFELEIQILNSNMQKEKQEIIDKHSIEKEKLELRLSKTLREDIEADYAVQLEKLKENYERERDALEARNRINEEEIQFLQGEVEQKELQLSKLDDLNMSVTVLQQDKVKILEEKQKTSTDSFNRESNLNESILNLQQKLQESNDVKNTLERKIKESNELKETLEFELINLKTANEGFENKISELKATKRNLEDRLDELLEDKNNTITVITNEHLEALNQSQLKEKALQQSFIKEKSILEDRIHTLKEKVEMLQDQINNIVDLETENSRLKQNAEDSENKMKLLEKELESQFAENTSLQALVKENNDGHSILKEQTGTQHSQIETLTEQLESKNIQTEKLTEQLKSQHVHTEELTEQLKSKNVHTEELTKQLESQRVHTAKLTEQLESQRVHTAKLTEQLESQRVHTEKLTEQLESQRVQTAKLTEQLESQRVQTAKLTEQLDSQRVHTKELTEQLESQHVQTSKLTEQLESQRVHTEKLTEQIELQSVQIEEQQETENKYKTTIAEKEILEKQISLVTQQLTTSTQSSENKENETQQSSVEKLIPSPDDAKIRLLQEELQKMMHRKDEYKRLAENLKKQLQELEKLKYKHDKEQISNLQVEKRKLEVILRKTSDQLYEATTELGKTQFLMHEVESWKEKTSNMVDIENYTKVQMNLCEQQRLVLVLQKALSDQAKATEKLHKDLVQEHTQKMNLMEVEKQKVSHKLEMYKSSYMDISEKHRCMLSNNKVLVSDNSKLLDSLRETVKREQSYEKKCHQLHESCLALQTVLNVTNKKTLSS